MNKGFLSIGPLTLIVVIGIIMLLLIPLYSIIGSQRSSTKRALYYTQKLRDSIDYVCEHSNKKDIQFNVYQGIPNKLIRGAYITSQGDPDYVIYYEAFKPGTGYSWEGYYGELPKNILFIYLNTTSNDAFVMKAFERQAIRQANETLKIMGIKTSLPMFYPVFANIEDEPKWIPVKQLGKIKYYMKNITSTEDKMIYKYKFCMNNSICLKTKSEIYAFPLKKCNINGSIIEGHIDNIANLNTYVIPLGLASPCKGEISISKVSCSCKTYKKYIMNGDKIKFSGNYSVCNYDDSGDRTCIMIDTSNAKGFCMQHTCTSNCFEANFPIEKDNFTIVRYDTFTEFTSSSVEKW